MKRIFTTTVRLNLDDADNRRAFEHLQRLDKRQYRSYSKAIVAAVNAYFDRQEQLAADPYLETREKEDAFLAKIEQTIRSSLRDSAPLEVGSLLQLLQGAQLAAAPAAQTDKEDISAALDFADSF
ncbi:MAG: adenylate cyclase [Clostridiales bacterium]|nr:adenylate cyclase [Clostridiales bacterium]